MGSLQIIADENIPCVREAFGSLGTVCQQPGRSIGPADVRNADVLLMRSVTSVGPDLLDGSSVQFVGSATIGTDHVDTQYLRTEGIAFAHAPGSNADSVADYVVVSLLALARRTGERLRGKTVGVIGCGHIGSRVVRRLSALDVDVLRNDPPRAAREAGGGFVSLDAIIDAANVLTLHVPLTTEGPHRTYHLMDADRLNGLASGAWLLNTSRGAVVHGTALREARLHGPIAAAALDVWEDEPTPDPSLIRAVDLATPHIAGYAHDGKVRGTAMLYRSLCDHVGIRPSWDPSTATKPEDWDALRCHPPDPRLPETDWLWGLARQAYDVRVDDASLRELTDLPAEDRADGFSRLRATYRRRRELQQHTVSQSSLPSRYVRAVEDGLTIQVN